MATRQLPLIDFRSMPIGMRLDAMRARRQNRMPEGLAKAVNKKRIESIKQENDMMQQLLRQLQLGQKVNQVADVQGASLDAHLERQVNEMLAFGAPPYTPPQMTMASPPFARHPEVITGNQMRRYDEKGNVIYSGPAPGYTGTTARFGPETVFAGGGDFRTAPGGPMYSELRDPLEAEIMARLDQGLEFKRKSALAGQGLAPGIADEAQRAAIGKVDAEADSLRAQIKALGAKADLESRTLLVDSELNLFQLMASALQPQYDKLRGAWSLDNVDPERANYYRAQMAEMLPRILEHAKASGAAPAAAETGKPMPQATALDLAKSIRAAPAGGKKVLRDETGRVKAHVSKTMEVVSAAMLRSEKAKSLPTESVARIARAIDSPAEFRKKEKPLTPDEKAIWRLVRNQGYMSGRAQELAQQEQKALADDILNQLATEEYKQKPVSTRWPRISQEEFLDFYLNPFRPEPGSWRNPNPGAWGLGR